MFHDTPKSAAKHVENIWKDIDSWWNNPEVTSIRNEFTDEYAYSNDIITNLQNFKKHSKEFILDID